MTNLLIFFVVITSFSPIFAEKAEAQWMTWDPGNFGVNIVTSISTLSQTVKDYALDMVSYNVINMVIQKVTADTVNWINKGFQGSPAFVTDPDSYFLNLGDKIAGDYIFRNPKLNFLCGTMSA